VLTVPPRWVDWCIPHPVPAWIAITWRADDDWPHTGARAALDLLLYPGHTETYEGVPLDWRSWNAYTADAARTALRDLAATLTPAQACACRPQPRAWQRTSPAGIG